MKWIRFLLTVPEFDDPNKTFGARMIYPILIIIPVLFLPIELLLIFIDPVYSRRFGAITAVACLLCFMLIWLIRRGRVWLANVIFISALWIVITLLVATGAGMGTVAFLSGYLGLIVAAGLLLDTRAGVITAAASTIAGSAVIIAQMQGYYTPAPLPAPINQWMIEVAFFWIVVVIQANFSRLRRGALRQAEDELRERLQAEQALRQSLEREQRLNEVSRLISSALDLETVVSTVVRLGAELVGAEMGSLALLTPDQDYLIETYNYNMPPELFISRPFRRGESLGWAVLESGQPLLVDDYQAHPFAMDYAIRAGIHGFIGVPIASGERVLGVLKLFSLDQARHFTAHDLELAVAIGQQAGIYIQNARLFEQTQQRAQQLSSLSEVGMAVATLRDLPELLEIVYQHVQRILDPEVFYVGLVTPDMKWIDYPFMYDSGKRWQISNMPICEGTNTIHVVRTGQPRLVNLTAEELAQPPLPYSQVGDTSRKAASLLFAPLRAGEQVIGVITAQSYTIDTYHEDDLNSLVGIANQVAIAIQNAHLYEAIRRQLDELTILHQISASAVEAEDETKLLQRVSRIIGLRVFSDDLSIWLLDEHTKMLDCRTFYHFGQPLPNPTYRLPLNMGIIGSVATRGQFRNIPDVTQETEYLAHFPWVRSELCIPMRIGERVIGIINVESKETGAFHEADERLLTTIADLLASAVERLRSEASLEQRVRERTAQLESANQELESFSYSVSHDLRAPLRAIDGYSRLLIEDYASQLVPEAHQYLEHVRTSAQNMGHLIDDLLEFSRLNRQQVRKQEVLPLGLVQQILDEAKPDYSGRNVEFILGDLPPCQADPGLLRQVFANLLNNAVKYSRQRDPARIEVGSLECDGERVYYVQDNGVGFDMHYVDRIFKVFQRLHRSEEFEGTGVGLATVQRIIQHHGGRVWAEGEVDKGATFYFTVG